MNFDEIFLEECGMWLARTDYILMVIWFTLH